MKTLKNKLTAATIAAAGLVLAALETRGSLEKILVFLLFAVPSLILFFYPRSIFISDHITHYTDESGNIRRK